MTRRPIYALALVALGAAVPPVLAASPTVDEGRFAAATITVSLPGGAELSLGLRAVDGKAGDRLFVSTARCDDDGCVTAERSAVLPDSALTIDPSTADARLRVSLGGQPLTIAWRSVHDGSVLVGGVEAGGAGGTVEASSYEGAPAAATVDYLGSRCREGGGVGDGIVADTSDVTGTPATAPLARLQVPAAATLRC